MFSALEKEGEDVLKKAKTFAHDKGVVVTTHMKQGHAGNEIITLAEEQKANLIVVGSHGKSKADRLLLGSVSNYVVTHGIITTLVVRS
jgi:nucleotide-binding universal stress UspA family protein